LKNGLKDNEEEMERRCRELMEKCGVLELEVRRWKD
jgi:hypothetical protein